MKFSITSRTMRSILDNVLRLGVNDATHPGYSLLHLEITKKGALRATVVNSQAAVRMAVPTGDESAEPGVCAMLLAQAKTVANNIPSDDEITQIKVTRPAAGVSEIMRIESGAILQKMPLESVDNIAPFPTPPDAKGAAWREVDAVDHVMVASRLTMACAPLTDARPNLTGVHMTKDRTEATNGHRITTFRKGLIDGDVLVPPAALIAASAIAGNSPMKIAVTGNRIWVHGAWFMMTCRLIEGVFPDTGIFSMAPDENGTVFTSPTTRAPVASATIKSQAIKNAASIINNSSEDVAEMQFVVRDENLVMAMKGGKNGLNAAITTPWQPHGDIAPEFIQSLTRLTLDARYVGSAMDEIKSEDVVFTWVNERTRVGFSAGAMDCVIMPKAV